MLANRALENLVVMGQKTARNIGRKVGRKAALALVGVLSIALVPTSDSGSWISQNVSAQNTLTAAAFVNDDVITVVDVASRVNLAISGTGEDGNDQVRSKLQRLVIESLINESLQLQEARRVGFDLPSNEVNEAASRIARQNGKTLSQFLTELEGKGVTRPTLLNQVKAQLSWQILVSRRFGSTVNISDADIARVRETYRRNANLQERQLSEIFLPYSNSVSPAQTVQSMQTLADQIQAGKNFSFLAQQFSQAPTAVEGGDLGWVAEGSLAPEIENQLRQVTIGNISPPIQTAEGVYLYGVRARRPVGKRAVGSKVRILQLFFGLPSNLESFEAQQKLARAAAIIQSVKGCEQFKTAIQRFGEQGSGDMGYVDPATLPSDLVQVAVRIEEGRVTPPYPVPNGAALFMVCDKQEVTEDVKDEEIRNTLTDEKLQGLSKRYLKELKSRAFIDVRLR